jgi:hypothetical protein
MLKSIKILLVIIVYHDYNIWQIDVKTIFPNGNLEEDVYVTQVESFESNEFHNKVYRL